MEGPFPWALGPRWALPSGPGGALPLGPGGAPPSGPIGAPTNAQKDIFSTYSERPNTFTISKCIIFIHEASNHAKTNDFETPKHPTSKKCKFNLSTRSRGRAIWRCTLQYKQPIHLLHELSESENCQRSQEWQSLSHRAME